jgi:arylformamidase
MKPVAPQLGWLELSAAQRDAAYNNNAAVAASADLIKKRDTAAAAYRARDHLHLNVAYGSKPRMLYDFYPAASSTAPCLIFVHGGYWQRNSREAFAHYAEGLAASGWSVAMPSYSLAPDARLRDIVEEIGVALDWIELNGGVHGISGPVVLAGWSAGAQLAALWLDHTVVDAGFLISGVYELSFLRDTFLNAALTLSEEEIATLSPLRRPPSKKPVTVAYGTAELPALIHDSVALYERYLAEAGNCRLLPVANADHFTILDGFIPSDGSLVAAAKDVLSRANIEGPQD